jgi:hypothetical protein
MYYLLDKKNDETYTINFIGMEQFSIGNTLKLIMPECVKNITNILSYTDKVVGETTNVYLKKFFKYKTKSTDEWSEAYPIEQLTTMDLCSKKCLQIELIYYRIDEGGSYPGVNITLSNVSIGGEYKMTKSDSVLILSPDDPTQIYEIGDMMKIFSISSFDVISTAKYGTSFTMQYRFSQDNQRSWTKWEPLTIENITTAKWNKLRFVEIQYLFELASGYKNAIKIYDVILHGDFQNVTLNGEKLNKFGLKENCINLAFKPSEITEQTSGIKDTSTTSTKTTDSTTQSLLTENSEYQLRMNFLTQGINCYSNPTITGGNTVLNQLAAENEANKANFWNPYEFEKIINFQNMLANQVSNILGMQVEYHYADPDRRGTDPVIHEYQLYNIVDYKMLKVIVPENQFPENNIIINQFNLDLFDTFKVNVMKDEYKNAFGIEKRPGQEDVLYFCQINRMFIVKHAQVHRNVMNSGIYYDLVLEKYEKRANVLNKMEESKARIEELTRNTTIDELFGIEEEGELRKIANKEQLKPKSFDFTRFVINSRTLINKESIYNGDMKIIESYYDFSNVAQTEQAVQYKKADNVLLKSDNRSFSFWFKLPNNYNEGKAINKKVIAGYDVSDNKYQFLNNISDSGLGYEIFFQGEYIFLALNNNVYKMKVDVSTNIWYSLVINIDQRQRKINMYLYRRDSQIDVVLFNLQSYEKLQLNMETDMADINYEMRVNNFKAVTNIENISSDSKPSLIEVNSFEIDDIEPTEFNHDFDLSVNGSKIYLTNLRVFSDVINNDFLTKIPNELIVTDAQYMILGDNANKKILTTNYQNKQWK